MEPNNNDGSSSGGLGSYYHPQLHHQPPPPPPATASPSPKNGAIVPNSSTNNSSMVYPHSVPSAVSTPLESVKRKRGRPRKYSTPEQAAAAKRLSAAVSPRKREAAAATGGASGSSASSSHSTKKSQIAALGNQGQSFSPHIINVAAGEDVGQKIMMFMQQSNREICIISASGSVSNVSLRQPATSGGSVTYEGRFDIISLSGSYIRTEHGGRTGGLSVCLSSSDGHIIGGGVGGPLTASGPIQVIVGTFVIDAKKEAKGVDIKLPSPIGGASVTGLSFPSPADSPHHQIGGGGGGSSPFLIQHRSMQMTPPPHSMEWRVGNTGYGMHQSPENGDYQHMAD